MQKNSSLFRSHLAFSQACWKKQFRKGDVVVDATVGNGHDTLTLAQLVIPEQGHDHPLIHAFDIQQQALAVAQKRLQGALTKHQLTAVHWYHQSHESFPLQSDSVHGIVYNLGYLPGGDKRITTTAESSLASLEDAMRIVRPGGLISVTCYPGHQEGARESRLLEHWIATLSNSSWQHSLHSFSTQLHAPFLLLLKKAK